MKLTWKNKSKDKKKRSLGALSAFSNLPFDNEIEYQPDEAAETTQLQKEKEKEKVKEESDDKVLALLETSDSPDSKQLAQSFQAQGNKLAEGGKYREALGKWETALTLIPENAVLHEQKAQVLLEIGDAWNALKAATRATELEPSWAEAWITLGRSQLNFGEPDCAIQSFDRALAIKPDSKETREDRLAALHLVKRRKQLQSSGLSASKNRYCS